MLFSTIDYLFLGNLTERYLMHLFSFIAASNETGKWSWMAIRRDL
jgi:hypothetical protein